MRVAWLLTSAAVVGLIVAPPGINAQSWTEYTITKLQRSTNLLIRQTSERSLVEARRADGSKVLADGDARGLARFQGVREIENTPDGRRIHVEDSLGFTTTFFSRGVRRPPTRDPLCSFERISASAKPQLTGQDEILGFKVVSIQTETGPFVTTVWKAPDLHCTELRMLEERKGDAGQVVGRFEMNAVSIMTGTPDSAWFKIPATYVEKSPLEIEQVRHNSSGRRLPESMQRINQMYLDNHRQAGVP